MGNEPTMEEMARGLADALADESRWCTGNLGIGANGKRYTNVDSLQRAANVNGVDSIEKACAEGRCHLLYSYQAFGLITRYQIRTGRLLYLDNDDPERGREYVRARLLELADAEAKR